MTTYIIPPSRRSVQALVIGFLLLIMAACQKDSIIYNIDPPPETDPIQIGCLMVGQQSRFIRISGNNYFLPTNATITYHTDTMDMKVIAEHAGVFSITEKLTPHSISVINNLLPDADTAYTWKAYQDNDTLWIEPLIGGYGQSWFFMEIAQRNSMFSLYTRSYLPLHSFGGSEVAFFGWKTTLLYSETYQEAHMVGQVLLNQAYPFLNVRVDNAPMAYDGAGATVIYEPKGRLVRSTLVGWWTQSGWGWDLLE